MRRLALVITLAFAAAVSGCSTIAKTGTLVGLGGAGAAAGYALSGGKAGPAAAGGVAGVIAGAAINNYNEKEQDTKFTEGYTKGQADAAKQHYWMLQRQQEGNTADAVGVPRLYPVTVPEQVDENGVLRCERTITIPIVE